MNIHAIRQNEKAIKIVQNIIKKYDGIFDPTNDNDGRMMAKHIVRNLKRNKLLKTYGE